MLVAKMLEKGQIVIPKEVRKKANLAPGDKFEVKVTDSGAVIILPLKKNYTESFRGRVKGRLSLADLDKFYAEKP